MSSELIERMRRIETKLTRYMMAQGFDTQSEQPRFDAETHSLHIPSRHVSLQHCLDAVTAEWEGPVDVYIQGDYVTTLSPGLTSFD